jgi:hypothetical protein
LKILKLTVEILVIIVGSSLIENGSSVVGGSTSRRPVDGNSGGILSLGSIAWVHLSSELIVFRKLLKV